MNNTADKKVTENADKLLQILVTSVNHGVLSFEITLTVGGYLISGEVVSNTRFFNELADEFTKNIEDPVRKKDFYTAISGLGNNHIGIESEDKKNVEEGIKEDEPLPSFIHLINTKFWAPGQNPIPSNQGTHWRGRLSEVSGFTMGYLRSDNPY